MIYDKLENLENYANVHPRFAAAIAYLKQLIAENAEKGRHDMPNCDVPGAVFANVNAYSTGRLTASSQMEAHRKYIDIQVMLEGEEDIYVPSTDVLNITKEYDDAADYELMALPAEAENVRLVMVPGTFAIFFAGEAHAPGLAHGEPTAVRKIVGKVLQ